MRAVSDGVGYQGLAVIASRATGGGSGGADDAVRAADDAGFTGAAVRGLFTGSVQAYFGAGAGSTANGESVSRSATYDAGAGGRVVRSGGQCDSLSDGERPRQYVEYTRA